MTVTGTLRYVDLEGGAWLLFADDGRRFELTPAPSDLASGTRVEVSGELGGDASVRMTGPGLKVHSLRRL